jgi:hypothetical protein
MAMQADADDDEAPDAEGRGPTPMLLLAAVERARRHRQWPGTEATLGEVLAHLGAEPRSAQARDIRAGLAALRERGELREGRRHGVASWSLTARGRQRLRDAKAAGTVPELPEAPQHREWRETRALAERALPRLHARLARSLERTGRMLERPPRAGSDAWLEAAEELRACARSVGCAVHCLREWPEPGDARSDADRLDGHADRELDPERLARLRELRAGRRNPRLWGC